MDLTQWLQLNRGAQRRHNLCWEPDGDGDLPGGCWNLCGYLSALGRHRANLFRFDTGARGLALDIVTQRTAAAAFRRVDRLVAQLPWVTKVQRTSELQSTVRIGDETRVSTINVQEDECGDLDRTAGDDSDAQCTTTYYSASSVVWRHGRIIGMVVTDQGQTFALELARSLLVRSQHPSD